MHIFSFESQPTMEVNIHNQCSDFRLTDGRYSNNDADWREFSNWRLYSDTMINDGTGPFLSTFGGILTYMLNRENIKPDEKYKPTHIRLFVIWKSEGYKNFRLFALLIECDKTLSWDKLKVKEYCQRYDNQLSTYTGPIENTWLIDDDLVVMIRLELDFMKRDGRLSITVSESVRDERTKRPVWINLKR
jgi:hypothetical protein